MKKGKCPFLVATDVAARGLHIDDLELVVNYDLPENCENYVHRIGRTARAGKSGMAISLVCEQFVYGLQAIEEYIDMKIPVTWFEEELYIKVTKPERRIQTTRKSQPKRSSTKKTTKKPKKSATASKKKSYTKKHESDKKDRRKVESKKKTPRKSKEDLKKMKKKKMKDRLKYYEEKYGETFTVVDHGNSKKKKKKSLLEKISKFFKK